MSITIELPAHVEALLRADAAAEGREVAEVAVERIQAWYAAQSGRGKPLQQFVSEQRAKHGLPNAWGTGKATLSDDDWQAIESAHAEPEDRRVP